MPHRLTFLLCLLSLKLSAQSDTVIIQHKKLVNDSSVVKIDTVVFESALQRNLLIGTCVLNGTRNQQQAKGYGLYLNKVVKTNCPKNHGEFIPVNKIISMKETDSTLIIQTTITGNCCHDFICDISVNSKDTLILISQGYGSYCACICCFGITFYIDKITLPEYPKIKGVRLKNE